ncbi:DUF6879 family protein [Micromonosporaceae bacterium Da 78-11]
MTIETLPDAAEGHIMRVYRHAVARGGIRDLDAVATEARLAAHEVQAAVDHLVGTHLLRSDPGGEPLLVAVDPEVATMLLVSPMEREIYRRREMIAQIRERTGKLRQEYARISRPATEAVDRVDGAMEVRGYLRVAGDACRREIMILQGGGPAVADLDDFLRAGSSLAAPGLAGPGIQVRILCQHRSRADLVTRMKVKNAIDAGAEVRTVSHVPRDAVVFDRSLAVLLGAGATGERFASRVHDDDVVAFLLDVFDHLWDEATPVENFDSGYSEVADDLQQTIAGMMAKGYTDEVLARKLGMSVRTCRRHISALMHDLEAVSRFQAGVQSVRRSVLKAS